jgi:hypothetical protein
MVISLKNDQKKKLPWFRKACFSLKYILGKKAFHKLNAHTPTHHGVGRSI